MRCNKLESSVLNICVIAVYRAPCGNFNSFLIGLDGVIKSLYKVKLKFMICGDENIDYLMNSDEKRQPDALLLSYNLSAIVHFPTRVQNQSNMAIDNIFIHIHKITNTASSIYNGLSDHDAQLLIVKDVNLQLFKHHIYAIRNMHKYSIEEFKIRLKLGILGQNF
jgi:hypothetical protein